jgi:hypothetical protein
MSRSWSEAVITNIKVGDLISYTFPDRVRSVGLVVKIHRMPYEVKVHDVVVALFGDSLHSIPAELCLKIND